MEKQMIIIFGGTGDLNKRKIIPALYNLSLKNRLHRESPIVCLGRKQMSKDEFIKHLQLDTFLQDPDAQQLTKLIKQIYYVRVDLDKADALSFREQIDHIAQSTNAGSNKLFYLALPANVFGKAANLIKQFDSDEGWTRVVFEKPFGEDAVSATKLNQTIQGVLREEQIYRVDHYLGKELVQNILTLRFRNELFKWAWHKDAIDHIQITASESIGVVDRAGYYDKSGAVRDMVQNHLLQLLSLVAMEPPESNSVEDLRNSSGAVIRSLLPVENKDVVLGQYDGYLAEKDVAHDSQTETFAAFKVFVDSPRWDGVPFYLRTGKQLKERYADIKIVFKHDKELCKLGDCDQPNMIIIRIQPDDGIAIAFNVRTPGINSVTEPVLMDFCHHCHFGPNTPEAYESILANVMKGEATVFPRWDWILSSWKFIDKLLAVASPPVIYQKQSTGPMESDELVKSDDRQWIDGEISPRAGQVKIVPLTTIQ